MTAVEFSEGAMGTITPQLCNRAAKSSIFRGNLRSENGKSPPEPFPVPVHRQYL